MYCIRGVTLIATRKDFGKYIPASRSDGGNLFVYDLYPVSDRNRADVLLFTLGKLPIT